jgi:hypothetical protein
MRTLRAARLAAAITAPWLALTACEPDHGAELGARAALSAATLPTSGNPITAVAVDNDFVYQADSAGQVARVAKSGGALATLTTLPRPAGQLAVDDTNLYAGYAANPTSRYWDGAIVELAKSGGRPIVLSYGPSPTSLAVQTGTVLWSNLPSYNSVDPTARIMATDRRWGPLTLENSGFISQIAPGPSSGRVFVAFNSGVDCLIGSASIRLKTPIGSVSMTADADSVYFAVDNDGLYRVPMSGIPTVYSGTAKGQLLAKVRHFPNGLRADADSLYWIDFDDSSQGALYKTSKSGGDPIVITTKAAGQSGMFTVDEAAIYWATASTLSVLSKGPAVIPSGPPQAAAFPATVQTASPAPSGGSCQTAYHGCSTSLDCCSGDCDYDPSYRIAICL